MPKTSPVPLIVEGGVIGGLGRVVDAKKGGEFTVGFGISGLSTCCSIVDGSRANAISTIELNIG